MPRTARTAWSVDAAARRLTGALAVSILLHAFVIGAMWPGAAGRSAGAGVALEARIESLPASGAAPADPGSAQASAVSLSAVEEATAAAKVAGPSEKRRESQPERALPGREVDAGFSLQRADGILHPLAGDPTYHAVAALDRPPVPLSSPDGCYPHGATGEVAYELMIDETGVVHQASVLSVTPVGLFTAPAAELCSAIRFSPAIKDGRAVRSKVRFVVGTR